VPDQNSDSPVDSGINITLGKLIAYPVGLLLVLSGVFGMTISFSGGLLMFISGIFSLPVIRSKIKDKTGIGVNRWAASALVLILFVGGVGLLGASSTDFETEASTNGATSDVDIADGGFKYPLDDRSYIVQFRKKNVVCKTDYYGGGVTFDAEGNAQSLAQTCANSISE